MERFLSARTRLIRGSKVRELLKWIGRGVISFGGGVPDPATFPVEEMRNILDDVLSKKADAALQYAPTEGVEELREELAKFMRRRGLKTVASNVIVTVGSQEALELLARVLIDYGDWIAMENPTYLGAIQAFSLYKPHMVGVPLDGGGLRIEALEEALREARRKGSPIKLLYTVPTCQNPTGHTLSLERRKALIELAEEYDFLIVEDDPYSYFVFEGDEPPTLKSMDESGRVIYVSTVSKILAPGLRIGWMVADEELVNWVSLAKQSVTLQSSTLCQYVLLEALKRRLLERQLPRLKELYRKRRDIMLEALEEYMPDGVKWTRPKGGLFIWLTAPQGVDMDALLPIALKKHGVAYVPGSAFHVDGSGRNTARLSFSYPPMEKIREGVARLARLIESSLASVPSPRAEFSQS